MTARPVKPDRSTSSRAILMVAATSLGWWA
jgi:hypothetical protein